jgi:FkbM family methyltransferase
MRPTPFLARLDLHSWLQRIAFLAGCYEEDTTRFRLRLHESSGSQGYILDVGANVGLIAIPLALMSRGIDPRVVAVEAVPDNIAALTHNIALNHLGFKVAVVPVGLGDERNEVDIQVEGNLEEGAGTGTANILPKGSTHGCVRQKIMIETLDDLWHSETIPRGCAVVKIDTDGYDLNVLRGGVEFLRHERPLIYGEFAAHCLRWHGQAVSDVIAFATANRYVAWGRGGRAWGFTEQINPDLFRQDLLLVPEEAVAAVDWCLCASS